MIWSVLCVIWGIAAIGAPLGLIVTFFGLLSHCEQTRLEVRRKRLELKADIERRRAYWEQMTINDAIEHHLP